MSNYMLSRRDGYDLRLSMMADRFVELPDVLIQKILGILGANEAATRIQSVYRGRARRAAVARRREIADVRRHLLCREQFWEANFGQEYEYQVRVARWREWYQDRPYLAYLLVPLIPLVFLIL